MRDIRFLFYLKNYLELAKIKVTLLVTFTTAAGFLLYSSEFNYTLLYTIIGILILASGSASLNQYQEKDIDAIMPRTKHRPIPSGRIKPANALVFANILIILGSSFLFLASGYLALILGFFSVLWYNGVYTYLKRLTAFAVVPGSLVGAIPPIIGWVAAGGTLDDIRIISMAFYLFMWQIPHFWLLLIKYGEDYIIAGLPSLNEIFSINQINRLSFIWIIGTISSAFILAFFNQFQTFFLVGIVLISSLLFLYSGFQLIKKEPLNDRLLFIFINIYTVLILLFAIIN